jgi:hypothetical protein
MSSAHDGESPEAGIDPEIIKLDVFSSAYAAIVNDLAIYRRDDPDLTAEQIHAITTYCVERLGRMHSQIEVESRPGPGSASYSGFR